MPKLVSVRLPEGDLEALKTVAQFDGVAVAEEIREAVKLLVQARRHDPEFVQRVQSHLDRGKAMLSRLDPSGKLSEALAGPEAKPESARKQSTTAYARSLAGATR